MSPDNNCYGFIKQWEGLNLTAYQDSGGIWTIGYGAIVYQNNIPVKKGDNITQDMAESLLEWEVNLKSISVNHLVTASLNQNQFNALISFAFNIGTYGLWSSTLLKRVNANSADPAIRDAFLMWDKAHIDGTLVVVTGLLNRRTQEANLYFS